MPAATISPNIFQKCLPALGTDIKQCGTVTICDVQTPTEDQLAGIFMSNGQYRMMNSLLIQDFEIKACGAIENGLYDFLMANKVDMAKRIVKADLGQGRFMIQPFIMALQKSRVNNNYMTLANGATTSAAITAPAGLAAGSDWYILVRPQNGIPADMRWFVSRARVFINGVSAGGSATRTAWRVVDAVSQAGAIYVGLMSENAGSYLGTTKAPTASASWPTTGLVTRGTPNVNDFEAWCEELPGLNNNKLVPFWFETVRNALCTSELYDKYRDAIIDNNPYYKTFADVSEVEKNQQLGVEWQRNFVESFFWNKKYNTNQTMSLFRNLPTVTVPDTSLNVPDEGACVGHRANAIGIYEQMAECGRVKDLQGQTLNLPELFKAIYEILQVRKANNQPSDQIDIFTDSAFAAKIQRAMVRYFKLISEDTLQMTYDITKAPTSGKFGFRFNQYPLDWPAVTLNVLSHQFFDDRIEAARWVSAAQQRAERFIWILDFAGIYPGIIDSNRVVNNSGDLQARAAVDSTYMCVMKVPTRKQTLTSTTYTAVVECPASNLLLENILDAIPEHTSEVGVLGDYYGDAP